MYIIVYSFDKGIDIEYIYMYYRDHREYIHIHDRGILDISK